MTVCLFSLAFTFTFLGTGNVGIALAVLSVCGNVAFFSVGIGPVCWVLTSEIFPLRLRAQAAALGAVGNRVCSGLVAMSFLSVADAITVGGTFFIFLCFQLFLLPLFTCLSQKPKENPLSKLSYYLRMSMNGKRQK